MAPASWNLGWNFAFRALQSAARTWCSAPSSRMNTLVGAHYTLLGDLSRAIAL
ncbi:hypothetical protein [Nocardia goodfellowii]|uniref:Uncharacterized protein n=1 Tax=Nocardia goodfellowii TaxID=882446 RepID=A0ABS4QF76_9NOCA|nr:hypothetical protein [Nocardia goodfellowii]MBP2190351.1 hypothetical protein [Nocardia goodfellowii]